MNGPGRKSIERRIRELEERTPRYGGGKMILFEWEISPGERPKPWYGLGSVPKPPIIIKLDPRPPIEMGEDDRRLSEGSEVSEWPEETAKKKRKEPQPWWAFAIQEEGGEIN